MTGSFGAATRRHPVLAWALTAALASSALAPGAARAADSAADLVARGRYLATAGDCVACHTKPGGKPFAGGLAMGTPFGDLVTPNITPDQATGIGRWTDDQFYRAMHDGIDDEGKYLYPVFPFPWYTKVSRDDVLAIKAYLFSLPPEHSDLGNRVKLAFPFSVRDALLPWRLAFFRAGTFRPDPTTSDAINRGAYLVEGLGHCGECHNHRAVLGASDWSGRLEGGQIEGWYAPNLTSDPHQGIGGWSIEQMVTFLKTGAAPGRGVVLGPMQETVNDSLRYLSDTDLAAMATYLKSVSPTPTYTPREPAPGAVAVVNAQATYGAFCASCHGADGKGQAGIVPALAGNGAVRAAEPDNVISVILGGQPARNGLAPMPAVGAGMNDQQIADAVNYVRESWGNAAPATAGPGKAAALRHSTHTLLAGNLPDGCPAIAQPTMAALLDGPQVAPALRAVNRINMLEQIDRIVPTVRSGAPGVSDDDLVSALTLAYCPVALHDPTLPAAERAIQLGTWAELVYGQLRGGQRGGHFTAANGG